ncbi:MAG: glycosyltransferase family 2 protein [Ardenticatenaceae bacterium]|nr:glycosyltransferase family 2 protein [Ardenticatenaceae bacterium]
MQATPAVSLKPTVSQDRPDLSIVLVCWNNRDYLEPCLRSLYESDLHYRFDVVAVDNGSTDGSQAMVRERFPRVRLLQNQHNAGLGRASNQGIEATRGRYVLLLNNDTVVNGPSLNAMVEFMESHAEAGAVGGRLLNPDGSFQAGSADFSSLRQEYLIATRLGNLVWAGYPCHAHGRRVKSVDWLSSACLLLRRQALAQVGLLDEEYFIYGDEADLQYRLKQAGWKVYYLPNVTTIHYGGRSMNRWRRRKMVYRGKMLFYQKNYGPFRTVALRALLGGISLSKIPIWAAASLLPRLRTRAREEIQSNLDVLKISAGDLLADWLKRGAVERG